MKDFSDILSSPQYFIEEIKNRLTKTEVFLDCGAYTGDTICDFLEVTNGVYDQIYAYELDSDNYEILKNNQRIADGRIIVRNEGVGKSNETKICS